MVIIGVQRKAQFLPRGLKISVMALKIGTLRT